MSIARLASRRSRLFLRGGGRLEDLEAENAKLKEVIVAMQQVGISAFPWMNSERDAVGIGESQMASMGTPERGMPGSETRDPVIGIYTNTRGTIVRRVFQGPGRPGHTRAEGVTPPPYYRKPGGGSVYEGQREWRGTWERLPADEVERRMAEMARDPLSPN